MRRAASVTLALLILPTVLPFALAQGASVANGCSGGIGTLESTCWFDCEEGEQISAYANGLAIAEASCGGGYACSLNEVCPGGTPRPSAMPDSGTCTVRGYFWLSYGCD